MRAPERALDKDFLDGRRLDHADAGCIDVQPVEARSAKGDGSVCALLSSIAREVSEGPTGEA
jgi:hypothetical protein